MTGAPLGYELSIAPDPEHRNAAGILPLEFVEIWEQDHRRERGSACCVLNGTAARTCRIATSSSSRRVDVSIGRLREFVSRNVIFGADDRIARTITRQIERNTAGNYVPVSVAADKASA